VALANCSSVMVSAPFRCPEGAEPAAPSRGKLATATLYYVLCKGTVVRYVYLPGTVRFTVCGGTVGQIISSMFA